jgi:ADP-heptose:LPS heptosyltransferase
MERLLVNCNLQPGDLVVLTAAIRDLNLAYPGRFRCNVWNGKAQAYPAIWENNPDIDKTISPSRCDRQVSPHYHEELRQSKTLNNMHFTEAYTCNLAKQLQLDIPVTEKRPVLYLSERERLERPFDYPYWVLIAGGKVDFTAKWWHAKKWQKLLDQNRYLKFIQVGATGPQCWNPRLRGAVDKLGQTTLRDLICYIYHAEGVICGITCGMHIAGAFGRFCVVVAGGREGPSWEKYPEHVCLHTIGRLPCCLKGACWKSHVDLSMVPVDTECRYSFVCTDVVDDGIQKQPRCLHIIPPETVYYAIHKFARAPT